MSLWNFSFGKQVKMGDEFFGIVRFSETNKGSGEGYFECQRFFEPIGKLIDLNLDGNLTGPNASQKAFFRQIERNYTSFIPSWIHLIEQEFGAWMPLPLVKDFAKEFTPTYLCIPRCEQRPVEWEIVFDTIHDLNHTVTIGMADNSPSYLRIDG